MLKKYYDLRVHFFTLTFSFFITFILNYAIFNLPLLVYLILFRIGLFGAAHGRGWGVAKRTPPPPKMFHTYLAMMKLHTVIPYLKKIQKIY